jgi:hypothetical protein
MRPRQHPEAIRYTGACVHPTRSMLRDGGFRSSPVCLANAKSSAAKDFNKGARGARTIHSLLWQLQRSLCGGSRCLLSFGQYPVHHPEAIDADGRRADTRGLILRPKLTTESAAYRVHWRSTRRQRSTRGQLSSRLRDAAVAHIDMRTGDHVRDLVLEPTAAVAPDDPNYSRRLWHGSPRSILR